MYICEFEFVEDGGWFLCWPFWPGRCDGIQSENFDEAVEMAADRLKSMVLDYLMKGEKVPRLTLGNAPQRGGRVMAIAVDASLLEAPAVTEKEAAERLGISHARVSQLCRDKMLDSWKVGSTRMVSVESIELRRAAAPCAGRPKRALAVVKAQSRMLQ